MAWTFTDSPDSTTTQGRRDAVRILVGDTDSTDELPLSDAAIDYNWSVAQSNIGAAILSARQLQAYYAREVNKTIGKLKVSASVRTAAFAALVDSLRRDASATSVGIFIGGTSVSENELQDANTNNPDAAFDVGIDDMGNSDTADED